MDVHVTCRKFIGDVVGKNASDKLIAIKHTINKRDIISLLMDPKWHALHFVVFQEVICDLKTIFDPFKVLQACDKAGISRQGYMAIYSVFLNALHTCGLKNPWLPRPYHVKESRKSLNSAVQDGGFYSYYGYNWRYAEVHFQRAHDDKKV